MTSVPLDESNEPLTQTGRSAPEAGPPRGDRRSPLPLRRPRLVLVLTFVVMLIGVVLAGGATSVLKNGGFDSPSSDSVKETAVLRQDFPATQPNLSILVHSDSGTLDGPAAQQAGARITRQIAAVGGVRVVGSYLDDNQADLRSADGSYGVILLRVTGDDDASGRTTTRLHDRLAGHHDGVTVSFGGILQINNDIGTQITKDLGMTESIALPLTLILLFFVFRGLVAALMPLLIGVFAILGSLAVLDVLGRLTTVSVFAVNLITAMGLGLAIDYSLLIVSRYREERAAGKAGVEAVTATLRTAGRTVLLSAGVVAAVLLTMLVFDQFFLRSFAYAGFTVVVITAVGALLPLPAALLLLGDRIDALSWRRRRPQRPPQERLWGRISAASMRRPVVFGLVTVALFVVAALPVGAMQVNIPDQRVLPAASESRQTTETISAQFPRAAQSEASVGVVTPDWVGTDADLAAYAANLSRLPQVTAVVSPAGAFIHGTRPGRVDPALAAQYRNGRAVYLEVVNTTQPYSASGRSLATAVRATPVSGGSRMYVGGPAAQLVDITGALTDRLPWEIVLAVLLTLVLLFLATGSVLLPVKAVAFNFLGLVAVLGVLVWIFQQGHLSGLLGFTPTPVAVSMPVLVLCIAYALSMDYEVFVLSRIKESHDAGADTRTAVSTGLGRSGPIVTAAAVILAITFLSMLASGVSVIKMLGAGAGLAILADATLIRGVLVPVFLRLVGPAAWWAPGWMRQISSRIGLGHR